MPKIDLGAVGAVVSPGDEGFVETASELERLGYSSVWITGGPLAKLGQVVDVARATRRVKLVTAILSVDRFPVEQAAELYGEIESEAPGRFVLGLGGAHGPEPIRTLTAYLDRLDRVPVPRDRRMLAALGPRMLDLARDRAAGALPVLVAPAYTAEARSRLGPDATLAVEQLVVVDTDPERAQALARRPLGFLGRVPAYQANFRRMGFTEDEIGGLDDRLVDSLVPSGDAASVAARAIRHLDAGADHVAVSLTTDASGSDALELWRQLAEHLIGQPSGGQKVRG